jgi:hypothetical protein
MLNTQLFQTIDNDYIDSETYEIDKSLRIRSGAYLSRTPTVASNRQTWTFSAWIKKSKSGAINQTVFAAGLTSAGSGPTYITGLNYLSDVPYLYWASASGNAITPINSTLVHRDSSAWYHLVMTVGAGRRKLYTNGILITDGAYSGDGAINNNMAHTIGILSDSVTSPFDGYIAEVNFIDGQALDASYFGRIDQTSGQWSPKKYGGTYGTNGFYLDFKNSTSLTTLCADKSGNNNHWTPTNISLTSGATYDSMLDTPTNNFPTLNPLGCSTPTVISKGNLSLVNYAASYYTGAVSSLKVNSGKWYWEVLYSGSGTNNVTVGFTKEDNLQTITGSNSGAFQVKLGSISYTNDTGIISVGTGTAGTTLSTGSSYTYGDVIGIALDLDASTATFYKNNVATGSVVTGLSGYYSPAIEVNFYANGGTLDINFGQRPFAYTPPAGFVALSSKNLPTPSIIRGETGMDIATYTGNGGNIQVGEYQFPRPNYLINRSLRFKGTNSHLSRTFGTPSNYSIATLSLWFKLSAYSTPMWLFEYANDGNFRTNIHIKGDNRIYIEYLSSGTLIWQCYTIQAISPSDWKHLVISKDLSATVASDRYKIYLNGVLQSTAGSYPGLNQADYFNSTLACRLGIYVGGIYSFNGYMAEVNFVDGQALTPTQFGEQDVNGYWIPKAYTGTYGTNGFYLPFSDNSALTTTSNVGIGKDFSGNGNYWRTNNISLTADSTYDSMIDSPTNNYATLDVLTGTVVGGTLYDGNLSQSFSRPSGTGYQSVHNLNIIPDDNLNIYFEIVINSVSFDGNSGVYLLIENKLGQWLRFMRNGYGQNEYDYSNSTPISIPAALVNGNIFSISINMETKKLTFALNGTTMGVLDGWSTNLKKIGIFGGGNGGASMSTSVNFGQRPFTYTPPTGFKSLSIPNIAEYTSDLESPDLVWIKSRSAATNHMLFDSIRGAGKFLSSNTNTAETTDVNSLVSFNKNGFYLGNNANVNTLNNTYVSWMWKAGASTVTNTAGTITSQVRADPSKGFSVVNYTTSAYGTIGHGLGIAPKIWLAKKTNGAASDWFFNTSLVDNLTDYLFLNSTAGSTHNHASGTSTATTVPASYLATSAEQWIMYCWSEIEGFSKFGKYTGNGSADGPFVYCGFKPRWILIKRADGTAANWYILDTNRNINNVVNNYLYPDAPAVEAAGGSTTYWDYLSNGFKLRGTDAGINASTATYIYAAFAETPFKYATAR